MTYTTVIQYTDESVRQCKDLAGFLKKRAMVEMEYAKGLFKLAQGYQKPTKGGTISKSANGPDEVIRSQLLSTSVWQAFYEYVDQTTKIAEAHRNFALSMQNNVLDPFTVLVKDMELVRKMQVEKGLEYLKNLQDAYASLKKAKEDYDVLQAQANDAQNNHMKARMSVGVREKEIEKLSNRAAVACEKAEAANETLQVCGEICKNAQEMHYGQLLPVLYEDIRKKELDRYAAVKKVLLDSVYMEKTYGDTRVAAIDAVTDRVGQIDIEEDVEEFSDTHMVDEPGRKGQNVSVSMLVNPVKAGRMLLKRGDFVTGWKSRYFVLMQEEQELYCFDNEAALKPREIIDLRRSAVHDLDDSYFTRPHCLQIISISNKGRQTYNLIAESAVEKDDWMRALRRYAFCCVKGIAATNEDRRRIAADVDEEAYITVRSFQLSVLEAKELPTTAALTPGLGGINPYCIILFDDVKQARTTTKSGDTPFWGDEYLFDDICSHFARLRIVIFNHSRLQRDGDLGYVSVNLNTVKPGARVEQWYHVKQLPRPNQEDSTWRGSIRFGFCLTVQHLLPYSHYKRFLELVTQPPLTPIKVLGAVSGMQRESVAKVFMNILIAQNMEMAALKNLLDDEIENTENPNIIFRGNSITTKALDQYMKIVGVDYLADTIGPLVKQLYMTKESCEVDPTRVDQPEMLQRNWKRLKTLVAGYWEAISTSARKCPRELVEIFAHIQSSVARKWGPSQDPNGQGPQPVHYASISGFIFLRFFCPAILHPKLFGLIPEHPDAPTARTFTLIAKILQNLANLTDFGSKEPYMAECNSFIEANVDSMKAYIDSVSNTRLGGNINGSLSPKRAQRVSRRDLECLYQYFIQNLDAVMEHPSAAGNEVVLELVKGVKLLEEIHRSLDPIAGAGISSSQSSLASGGAYWSSGSIPQVNVESPKSPGTSSREGFIPGNADPGRIVADRPPQIEHLQFSRGATGNNSNDTSMSSSATSRGVLDPTLQSDEDLRSLLRTIGEEASYFPHALSMFTDEEFGIAAMPQQHVPQTSQGIPIPPERKGSRNAELLPPSTIEGLVGPRSQSLENGTGSVKRHQRKRSGAGRNFIRNLIGGGGGNSSNLEVNGAGDPDRLGTYRKRFGSSSSLSSNTSNENSWPQSAGRGSLDDRKSIVDETIPSYGMPSQPPPPMPPMPPIATRRQNTPPSANLPHPPSRVRGPRPSEESLSYRAQQQASPTSPLPDDYGDPSSSPTSEDGGVGRPRSVSVGSKMKNRLSVMWKSGPRAP